MTDATVRAAAPGRPKQGPTLSEGRTPYQASGVRRFGVALLAQALRAATR